MYPLNLNVESNSRETINCFFAKECSNESWLWYRRLSYLNFKDIYKIVLGDLVWGLPLLKYDKDHLRATREMGKQSRKSHYSIINTTIVEPLELFHINLCGPSSIESIGGNKYILVIVDDF